MLSRILPIAALIFGLLPFASPAAPRSMAERVAFVRHNPCPATNLRRGACPGWEVDHVGLLVSVECQLENVVDDLRCQLGIPPPSLVPAGQGAPH